MSSCCELSTDFARYIFQRHRIIKKFTFLCNGIVRSFNVTGTTPLYLRTLRRYTNPILLLFIIINTVTRAVSTDRVLNRINDPQTANSIAN